MNIASTPCDGRDVIPGDPDIGERIVTDIRGQLRRIGARAVYDHLCQEAWIRDRDTIVVETETLRRVVDGPAMRMSRAMAQLESLEAIHIIARPGRAERLWYRVRVSAWPHVRAYLERQRTPHRVPRSREVELVDGTVRWVETETPGVVVMVAREEGGQSVRLRMTCEMALVLRRESARLMEEVCDE